MSAWKPKIWKSGCMWICSYYRNSIAGAYGGSTPASWCVDWRSFLAQQPKMLSDHVAPVADTAKI